MNYQGQPQPSQNVWFGNNYSSGYSQPNRTVMNPPQGMTPQSPMPGMPQQAQTINNVIQVMGPESANEFRVGPNSRAILMDLSRPVMYMKQSDDSGYAITKAFAIHEIPLFPEQEAPQATQPQQVDYVTRSEFEKTLSDISTKLQTIEELVMNNG